MQPPHPHPAVPADPTAHGWYRDPWGPPGSWRWWDGRMWTPHVQVTASPARRPRLPAWLSVPVILAAIPFGLVLALTVAQAPLALPLGIVPALIVGPTLVWLDRVEPEPVPARVHAFLWGATVAAALALLVNSLVDLALGEVVATVVSAPVVEELGKAGAIAWALRRREVDGVVDGIVYAAWAAVGFAVVEDVLYFSQAALDGQLVAVFIIRALLAPFAHPLFTAWIGMGVGWAVSRGRPVLPAAAGGYVLAVLTHAMWNGSLVFADTMAGGLFLLLTAVTFVVLFLAVVVAAVRLRRGEERRFVDSIPWLAGRYGLAPAEVQRYARFRDVRQARRRLGPADRRRFDAVHAALARLTLLHHRPGEADPQVEQRLVEQLQRARAGGR